VGGMFLERLRALLRPAGPAPARAARRPRRAVPRLEYLEDRILLTTDFFINPLGGAWPDGGNWSLGAPPAASQDATVTPGAGVAVTHSSGTDTVHSLTSDGSLLVSGGSLAVTGDLGGVVRVAGGGELDLSDSGATQGDVTLDLSGGARVSVSGSLDN